VIDLQQQHSLWDEFLENWPISRLKTMELDEYTKTGSQDTFTYWLEFKLAKIGSISGGSAFKFGIYSRKDHSEKSPDESRRYSCTHAWYAMHGHSAEEAFENVRSYIVRVANLAAIGDLDGIESVQLGTMFAWKIAFLYQDRTSPLIVGVFTESVLAQYAGESDRKSMVELQRAVMKKRSSDMDILEYGQLVWENSQDAKIEIWKLSHGGKDFPEELRDQLLKDRFAMMYGETEPGQGKNFVKNTKIGTLFYLCHGNSPQLIGQFETDATNYGEAGWDGWMKRRYQVLKSAIRSDPFSAHSKKWSPRGYSTFWKVPESELQEFEELILKPYFETDLAKLFKTPNNSIKEFRTTRDCINRIYYGPPGTGKTYELVNLLKQDYGYQSRDGIGERCCFVTFHQSYGYEEFVEGLRPALISERSEGDDHTVKKGSDVKYEIRPGIFKELCTLARNSENRFAMVIDEINRGNISKIFGELITLIEPDKREKSGDNAVTVTLPYSGEKFSIPSNVDIYGTMNTADRSLATLDTALRRRFEFIPLRPDSSDEEGHPLAGLRVNFEGQEINIPQMLTMINTRIEVLYDRDHCIGHAYFMSLKKKGDGKDRLSTLANIFQTRVLPLLEEYFFEDWQKIRLILADNNKKKKFQFITEGNSTDTQGENLGKIFDEEDIDSYATKKIFRIQEDAFKSPTAYIGVYRKI